MTIVIIILLIIAGLALLLVEAVLIPGITVATIAAIGAFGYAIYLGYEQYGIIGATGVALLIGVATPIIIYKTIKSKHIKKMQLNRTLEGSSTNKNRDINRLSKGDIGVSTTRLASVGMAEFGDVHIEVRSEGEMIDNNRSIIIVDILSDTVIVRENR